MSVSFPNPLTEKEEKYYIEASENGDEEAKKILIERNLRLVAHVARKYSSQFHTMDDFISIGTIGLIKAVNTYSSSRSTRLATYAARCIENEILMVIRSSKKNNAEVSINVPIGTDKDGNEISLNDILGTDPDEIADDLDLKIRIRKMIDTLDHILTDREKKVLIYRYGILGVTPRTQREVAAILGISRSYVSRIEKKALEKLRESLAEPDTV
ncbi:MAG: RNA polymerase sporulation sigma factor SigK [Bacillota bacterium]|nr:RNA polymerase sporulation sigma factor SigK [Bacillota bacterium]